MTPLQLKLLQSLLLTFSSASSIEFAHDRLYIIGDDATDIGILSREYVMVDTIPLFQYNGHRIPKADKVDIETSFVNTDDNELVLFGSGATKIREQIFGVALNAKSDKQIKSYDVAAFFHNLKQLGLGEINLEGSTLLKNNVLVANRGNHSNPTNYLLVTNKTFYKRPTSPIRPIKLRVPQITTFIGVSELHYIESVDLLLITFSSEETSNAYDDGKIGDSYLGWIHNVSGKLSGKEMFVEDITNLSKLHPDLAGQKIEGVCAEPVKDNSFILHLVSDNDDGQSRIFRISATLGQ